MEEAITTGWLQPCDILVCDNARIHEGGVNVDLSDFLWDSPGSDGTPLNMLLLPLPTQSLELNPIELLWNTLSKRLNCMRRGVEGSSEAIISFGRLATSYENDLAR